MSNFDGSFLLEGQWITGKGTTATGEDLTQTATKSACQYGAVNTRNFAAGPGVFDSMYGNQGKLHFPCSIQANQRTYQGVVAYDSSNKYFYAINPDSGRIQVCWGVPRVFEDTVSLRDLTRDCSFATRTGLRLGTNKYFSAVGILNNGKVTSPLSTSRAKPMTLASDRFLSTSQEPRASPHSTPIPSSTLLASTLFTG